LTVIHTSFVEDDHIYAINGNVVRSITQVLGDVGFIDYSMVPQDILAAAQARGTRVHKALHYHLEGVLDWDSVDEVDRGYVESGLEYLDRAQLQPLRDPDSKEILGVEYRFWDERDMTAGTIDYLAWEEDGWLSVNDWKTGEPSDVAAPLQTAAYAEYARRHLAEPLRARLGRKPLQIRRRAIKLFKDGAPGRAVPYNDPRDWPQFLAALSCVHFKRNGCTHRMYGRTA
jgi:hypothetical protein